MLSIEDLTHHRWALPIVAELDGTAGSRFVPLASRLGLSRAALRQTLDALINLELVMPNPGYGHPSRPEYVLTDRGRLIAPACTALVAELRSLEVEDVGLKKWTLPALEALAAERRYGELASTVDASPRALTLALKDLVAARLVERRVYGGYPPSTTYRVAARGRGLQRRAARLAAALTG